jgi:hypothetical protein
VDGTNWASSESLYAEKEVINWTNVALRRVRWWRPDAIFAEEIFFFSVTVGTSSQATAPEARTP